MGVSVDTEGQRETDRARRHEQDRQPEQSCLRADARENRERILRAAEAAFAEEGLDASLASIARRAGVGNATVHRNFTREALIDALFSEWFQARSIDAETALADADPWHGLSTFLVALTLPHTKSDAIRVLLATQARWRERVRGLLEQLVGRAADAGALRPGLTAQDVVLALMAAGSVAGLGDVGAEQAQRQLALVLDGMRSTHQAPLPGAPLTPAQLEAELRVWAATRPIVKRALADPVSP